MKRSFGSIVAVIVFAGLLTGGFVLSHATVQHPHGAIGNAASAAVADSPLPSPDLPSPSPVNAPQPSVAAPAASTPVATVLNPLPSPTSPPASSPAQAAPPSSPTPDPSADQSPSPSPPPVQAPPPSSPSPVAPPVCIWSVSVQTLANDGSGGWANLGTWNGSTTSGTVTSPIFITGVLGWLQYTYTFSDACSGHASITSYYVFSGNRIYTDSAGTSTRQANIPAASQVDFVVTVQ